MKLVLVTIALAVGLLLAGVIGMAVKVLFVRGGRFPSGHACRGTGARHRNIRIKAKTNQS